jgi:hypothetical protein
MRYIPIVALWIRFSRLYFAGSKRIDKYANERRFEVLREESDCAEVCAVAVWAF